MKAKIHLHWSQDPKLLHGVTRAVSICGIWNLPREQVTAFREDTTCRACLEKTKEKVK